MQNVLHHNPLSAWNYLCNAGGIELGGRDEGLDENIRLALNSSALTLEDALSGATMDEFLPAFFAGIHPYIMIFRDILDFFENADATKGQSQWVLQVDNVDVSLEHFREWIETWTKIENVKLEVPALIPSGAWKLLEILRKPKVASQIQKSFNNKPLDLPIDVQKWVDAYYKEQYFPIPSSLLMPEFPDELHDSVLIAQAVVSILMKQKTSRRELIELLYKRPYVDRGSLDNFDFWQIIQNETDHFLCALIVSLSACATLFEPDELNELARELNVFINEYPRTSIEMDIQLSDFDSILSLPIWKKRYELYSVWIATEILRALNGHDIELHHDNGLIAFAFHETLIATVHSVQDPFTLISERRSPLLNPIGKGRSSAVQPDYGLATKYWTKI